MGFISYQISGVRYFLLLAIPAVIFLFLYVASYINYKKKPERSHAYFLGSRVLMLYLFVFFLYMFFGLRLINMFNL